MMGRSRCLLLALALASTAADDEFDRPVPVEDQVDVVEVDRRLIAVGAKGDSIVEASLELGERVVAIRSQGLLGVAATNVRLLGVTSKSGGFKTLRYRVEEREALPEHLHLADRVALVPLASRVAALASSSTSWQQFELGSAERVRRTEADSNLGLVLTNRRAVAFSARSGGFVEIGLTPEEEIDRLEIEDGSVTLVTDRRVLVFRAGRPVWSELIRKNRRD